MSMGKPWKPSLPFFNVWEMAQGVVQRAQSRVAQHTASQAGARTARLLAVQEITQSIVQRAQSCVMLQAASEEGARTARFLQYCAFIGF